jgi:hypothetical protein
MNYVPGLQITFKPLISLGWLDFSLLHDHANYYTDELFLNAHIED